MNGTPLIAKISNRHFRKKNGLCLAEGLRCCQEAVSRKPEDLKAIFCTEDFKASRDFPYFQEYARHSGAKLTILSNEDFKELGETETPQGILAVMKIPEYKTPEKPGKHLTLILDRVADPGNLGTILRTAWAVGLDACWLVKGCADPFSPKAVRSGMGAQFAMAMHLFQDLEEATNLAHTLGVKKIWCTMPSKGISIFSSDFYTKGTALIIGNEANGISKPELGTAVTIPMPGNAESLNAAQAATVFLVESLKE